MLASCSKTPTITAPPSTSTQKPSTKTTDKLPGGGTTPSSNGELSGVSTTTGYEQLQKHLDVNGIWDGTYDFSWYDYQFNVSLAVKPNAGPALGWPVSFYFNQSSPAFQMGGEVPVSLLNIGPGINTFQFTYTLYLGGGFSFYQWEIDENGLTKWQNASNAYWTQLQNVLPGGTYPLPPLLPTDSIMVLTSNGSSSNLGTVVVYGKFIEIVPGPYDIPGIPYAVAEIGWTPIKNNQSCNTMCEYCALHPNDVNNCP